MPTHPENSKELNDIISMVEGVSMENVWCEGCEVMRQVNSVYLPYLENRSISSCRFCNGKF